MNISLQIIWKLDPRTSRRRRCFQPLRCWRERSIPTICDAWELIGCIKRGWTSPFFMGKSAFFMGNTVVFPRQNFGGFVFFFHVFDESLMNFECFRKIGFSDLRILCNEVSPTVNISEPSIVAGQPSCYYKSSQRWVPKLSPFFGGGLWHWLSRTKMWQIPRRNSTLEEKTGY